MEGEVREQEVRWRWREGDGSEQEVRWRWRER